MVVKPKNIHEYLAALGDDKRAAPRVFRKIIKAAVPKAEECISYQIPAFRLNGKCSCGSARRETLRLYRMLGDDKDELKDTTSARARSVFNPTRPYRLPSCGSWSRPGSRRTSVEATKHGNVVFTMRGKKIRLISMRHVRPAERKLSTTKTNRCTRGPAATVTQAKRLGPQDLARVHDVVGVNRLLYCPHYTHRFAVLGDQEVDLAATDAVLASACAVE